MLWQDTKEKEDEAGQSRGTRPTTPPRGPRQDGVVASDFSCNDPGCRGSLRGAEEKGGRTSTLAMVIRAAFPVFLKLEGTES